MSRRLTDPVLSSVAALETAARLHGGAAASRARESLRPQRLALAGGLLLAFFVPFTAGAVQGEQPAPAPAAVLEPPAQGTAPAPPVLHAVLEPPAQGTAPAPPVLHAVPALPQPPAVERRRPRPKAATPVATPAPIATPEPTPAPAPAPAAPAPALAAPAPAPEPPEADLRLVGMSLLDDIRVAQRRPSGAVAGGIAALALAAAGGWWLGAASQSSAPVVERDSVAAVGDLRLELEAGWVPAEAAPGPRVEGGQAYAPMPGLAARALLVTGPAADASLVPAALRTELPERLPAPRRATLADLEAWSYGPFRAKDRVVEVTVAPTTSGVLAVTCSAPPASWSAALDCADGVHAITSAKAQALAPAADLAFRQSAGPILGALDDRRVAARRRLARARRPGVRAATVRALAGAHRTAADGLGPLAAAGASGDVVAALRDAARGYDALAVAARRGNRPRFIAARAAIARADTALAGALLRLRR